MAHSDRRVSTATLLQEERREGLPDDVAPTQDHDMLSGRIVPALEEELLHTRGRRRREAWGADQDEADVDGMKAVDVLEGRDRRDRLLRADLRGQRLLYENPVHIRTRIQFRDFLEELLFRGVSCALDDFGMDPDLLAPLCLRLYVHLRRAIVAHEDRGETWAPIR